MPRKKNSPDVAPMIRAAFKRAVLALEDGGRPLSTLIKESLEKDVNGTLRAIGTFTPKELEVTRKPASLEEMNDDELEQLASLAASILSGKGEGAEDTGETELNSVH